MRWCVIGDRAGKNSEGGSLNRVTQTFDTVELTVY